MSSVEPSHPQPSDVWELDFYSRPVLGLNGKKLWELLLCDSTGSFQHVEEVPSNLVNSRELRRRIVDVIRQSKVQPQVIRFFRSQMKTMITIALSGANVIGQPSRRTYALYRWLEEREEDVYPLMPGYQGKSAMDPTSLTVNNAIKMPDQLRGEQFAFVSLQFSELVVGSISGDNIGLGSMCPIYDSFSNEALVPGVVIFSSRAQSVAAWIAGADLVATAVNLRSREMYLDVGLDTQYLFAKLNDQQLLEAQAFEEGKQTMKGLHFLAVQRDPNVEEVAGFWLLKDLIA